MLNTFNKLKLKLINLIIKHRKKILCGVILLLLVILCYKLKSIGFEVLISLLRISQAEQESSSSQNSRQNMEEDFSNKADKNKQEQTDDKSCEDIIKKEKEDVVNKKDESRRVNYDYDPYASDEHQVWQIFKQEDPKISQDIREHLKSNNGKNKIEINNSQEPNVASQDIREHLKSNNGKNKIEINNSQEPNVASQDKDIPNSKPEEYTKEETSEEPTYAYQQESTNIDAQVIVNKDIREHLRVKKEKKGNRDK